MDLQKQFSLITNKQISHIIGLGFSQLYNNKPNFPVTYLANWLKQYSSNQKHKTELINKRKQKQQKYQHLQRLKQQLQEKIILQNQQIQKNKSSQIQSYKKKLIETQHLQDLLGQWLPQFIQKSFNFTGAYVGKLDFSKKNIQENNWQVGAQNDTENPKIITYVGASQSHRNLMIQNVLSNGKGVSYVVFQQKSQENNEQGQQAAQPQKKKYFYIDNVLKQSNLHYFKFPKLGSYACYPIKIKNCLNISSLDKSIIDYKAYIKTKQQTQKQYQQKVNQAKTQAEDSAKKVQDFQLNEQDPASHQQKNVLQSQAKASQQKLQQILKNPPIIQQVKFQTLQKYYFLGCDTLGQDREIPSADLQNINDKITFFINQLQLKQRKMLLTDILTFLQQQPQLQTIQAQVQQHEKNVLGSYDAQIKQQFANKERQAEYQLSIIKCQKLKQLLFNQATYKNSKQVYLNYNVPKFIEVVQICCMLVGQTKQDINIPKSNVLNARKIINKQYFKNLMNKLDKYQLRRDQTQNVKPQYKINKLLERLQKVQTQALSKYNAFLYVLHLLLKTICWTRIYCRDAKKQIFETKTRLRQQRENEIQKWLGQIEKSLQTAKAQLDEQGQQNFKQQDWRRNYETQNPRPQSLEVPVLKEYLDIE